MSLMISPTRPPVGDDWNCFLPAFKDANGVSIPFKPTGIRPPIGYQGDFYVDEFTDAKIKQAWRELKEKNPEAAQKIIESLGYDKDGKNERRDTGTLDLKGVINGNDDLKLTDICRPVFFGQVPYFEKIAKVEQNTYTVEFTVPRGYYERVKLNLSTPIKLRGWFIRGNGVSDAKGKRVHPLFIFCCGYSSQITVTSRPEALSEQYLYSRKFFYDFNQAGFDVLIVDTRGKGISGGANRKDNSESAEDIFRMLDQLELGIGLTVLTPTGQLLQGKESAGLLLRGMSAKQVPVLIGGHSMGTFITCYVMQKNFIGWTAYNEPDQKFSPAKKYNIKAAFLLGDNVVHTKTSDFLKEGASRVEMNSMYYPTSEILANIDKWPAVFFGKGLWDSVFSPEGTYEAYRRVKGLKELVFYRGPHNYNISGSSQETVDYLSNKMIEFGVRALVNPEKKYPELKSFKEAVLSSPPYWP
jgi:hypothetical protein